MPYGIRQIRAKTYQTRITGCVVKIKIKLIAKLCMPERQYIMNRRRMTMPIKLIK